MKILISAYACEPNSGSESEIGWSWIKLHIKKRNKLYVITRKSNRKKILKKLKYNKNKNIFFLFYDLPIFFIKLFKHYNKNSYIYFLLWQIGIYFKYKSFINSSRIELIHHVTFGSVRIPSFLSLTNKKFIYGPLAGGETVPKNLLKSFTLKSKFFEYLRFFSNITIKYSIFMNKVFTTSAKIFLANEQTLKLVNKKFLKKCKVVPTLFNKKIDFKIKSKNSHQVYFAGRLIDWKGIEILKKIFIILDKSNLNIILNIYGEGNLKNNIKDFISKKNFNNKIRMFNFLKQKILLKKIKENDLLIFPTLRDSGGYVILEALNNNINIITTNAAGPKSLIIKNEIGLINIYKKTEDEIAKNFANKIIKFYKKKRTYRVKLNKYLNEDNKYEYIYN